MAHQNLSKPRTCTLRLRGTRESRTQAASMWWRGGRFLMLVGWLASSFHDASRLTENNLRPTLHGHANCHEPQDSAAAASTPTREGTVLYVRAGRHQQNCKSVWVI
ncbi:hypothetical protein BDW22DRAFT_417791 [Trametopsis cervina]|nr:hypothetical protein BDW22DRAFT_417791 [Trametopsis cervina]